MRSFRSDPYLWIHLAGAAALPIFLELCVLGLATGDPFLPAGIELLLVAAIGILPIFWMQWEKPFCIFSLVALALKPDQLSEPQRQILRLFKAESGRIVAAVVAVLMAVLLWQLYRIAPLVSVPVLPQSRLLGLGVAAIAFLFANLFVQVPASVLRVLLTGEAQFAAAAPYETGAIAKDFTLIGAQVRRILPPMVDEEKSPGEQTAAPKIKKRKVSKVEAISNPIATSPLPIDSSPWDDSVWDAAAASDAASSDNAMKEPDSAVTGSDVETAIDSAPVVAETVGLQEGERISEESVLNSISHPQAEEAVTEVTAIESALDVQQLDHAFDDPDSDLDLTDHQQLDESSTAMISALSDEVIEQQCNPAEEVEHQNMTTGEEV